MLLPAVPPPFPLQWGFSTVQDAPETLPPQRLRQVHGIRVVEARDAVQEADGIWTQEPGLAMGVRVADCVPILLAGSILGRPWISALHAGWRGATQGILRVGVGIFQERGGDPSTLVWALGPAIQACHFEVGDEVVEAARQDPAWQEGLTHLGPGGRPHLDLHGLLRAQALHLGLDPRLDGSIGACTFCERDLLFSYRRGDRVERQWGWARIEPKDA